MKTKHGLLRHNETLRTSLLHKNGRHQVFKDEKVQKRHLREIKRAEKRIILNNKCIEAFEQGLTKTHLEKSLDDIIIKLKWIDDEERFKTWLKNTPITWKGKSLHHWQSINNRATLTKQQAFLNYILA